MKLKIALPVLIIMAFIVGLVIYFYSYSVVKRIEHQEYKNSQLLYT